jgi:hypothetical protein
MIGYIPSLRSRGSQSCTPGPHLLKKKWLGQIRPCWKHALCLFLALLFLLGSQSSKALPLLTEIHYNGISSGSDPDEFLEISNAGTQPLNLSGYSFTAGIAFTFPGNSRLAPLQSLVIARNPADFRIVFPDFSGALFDFSGALSHSGETLTLKDGAGFELWSISYNDSAPWPIDADGLGASLQFIGDSKDIDSPARWIADAPNPGSWVPSQTTESSAAVSAPASLALLSLGLFGMRMRSLKHRTPQARPSQGD